MQGFTFMLITHQEKSLSFLCYVTGEEITGHISEDTEIIERFSFLYSTLYRRVYLQQVLAQI